MIIVGVREVTSVPNGTVTAISVPVITPTPSGKLKETISFAGLAATVTVTI